MEQRQQLLQEFLKKNGGITRLEYSSLTGLSRLKAIDDLNTFIEKGILVNVELEEPCFMSGNRKNDNQLKNPRAVTDSFVFFVIHGNTY